MIMTKTMFYFLVLTFFFFFSAATATVLCDSNLECEQKIRRGSICNTNGHCTNPFATGCLRRMKEESKYSNMMRMCNSHDDSTKHCSEPGHFFAYPEIRISPNNWESAMFFGWVVQILLSEVLGVPASIESGKNGGNLNFYDISNAFDYPEVVNDFEALAEANRVQGICSKTEEPCAHFMPEVWREPDDMGDVERNKNGLIVTTGWFLSKHTAYRNPSLTTFLGLQGNQNRKKLAETFLRPTSWKDYCSQVSPTQCTANDGVAKRPPILSEEKEEENLYYSEDNYIGHFRSTEKNNCTINPNCTGHIIDYPCSWQAYTDEQIYWNKIALETDIEYSYDEMIQVVKAANATDSDILLTWWNPEPTVENFMQVSLPKVTKQCLAQRSVIKLDRCTLSKAELRGKPGSGCGYLTNMRDKFYANTLQEAFIDEPLATRSPAYPFLKNIQLSDIDIGEILNEWNSRGVDKYGYDGREAVCKWVTNNIDTLTEFIPPNYPRKILERSNSRYLSIFTIVLGSIVTIGVLVTFSVTYYHEKNPAILYAQPGFLYLILTGYLLISISAILYGLSSSNLSCMARVWFELIGYTLSDVPLLVKTAAINALMQNAKKMKRATIHKSSLFLIVGLTLFISILYLFSWTLLDPSRKKENVILISKDKGDADLIINCSSESSSWTYFAHSLEMFYIFCASILAVQSRNVMQRFNESESIRRMAYVSFLFLLCRLMFYYSMISNILNSETSDRIIGIFLCFDVVANLSVYFGPKFWKIMKNESNATEISRNCEPSFRLPTEKFICMKCKNQYNANEISTVGQPVLPNSNSILYSRVPSVLTTGNKIMKTRKQEPTIDEKHLLGNDEVRLNEQSVKDLSETAIRTDESVSFHDSKRSIESTGKEIEDHYNGIEFREKQTRKNTKTDLELPT